MCNVGSALFGTAANGAQAATSGLFGTAGNFALGNALGTIGTGIQLASTLQSSEQANDISKQTYEIAQQSADISKQEAELIQKQGDFDLQQSADEARRLKGRQIVSAAKSGVTSSGSVLEIMNEAAEIAEQEALEIEMGTSAGVSSKLFEAQQELAAGKINSATASIDSTSSKLSAASTLLTSFGGKF